MNLEPYITEQREGEPVIVRCCECKRVKCQNGDWQPVSLAASGLTMNPPYLGKYIISDTYCDRCKEEILKGVI
jgi:hypothetical protein